MMSRLSICFVWFFAVHSVAWGQLDFEGKPINYGQGSTQDRVAKFAEELKSGKLKLTTDSKMGYLPAVLKALQVPEESQTLVFSKTSFQLHKIDPVHPRAVYFNDDTYVGWVNGGEVLELASTDPEQGAIFYTFETEHPQGPTVLRDQGQCLICHGTVRTQGVPGYLVRSVFCNPAGRFVSGTPSYVTDHASPFEQRWGGWYVTGTHGSMRHLGNALCRDESYPGWINRDAGANANELPEHVDAEVFLRPSSDLVALMVMEHQSQMHNLITRASYETRTATYQDSGINEALGRPEGTLSESTQRRIASVGERMLKYMLFADEIELESPVTGSSEFSKTFSQRGPQDKQGRSFYQLDLQRYLVRYPVAI